MTTAPQTAPAPAAWTPNFIESYHNGIVKRAANMGCCFVEKLEVTAENHTLTKILKIVAFALVSVAFTVYDLGKKICCCFTNDSAATEKKAEGQPPAPAGGPGVPASAEEPPAAGAAAAPRPTPPAPGAVGDPKVATDAALQVVGEQMKGLGLGLHELGKQLQELNQRVTELVAMRGPAGLAPAHEMAGEALSKEEFMREIIRAAVPAAVHAMMRNQVPEDGAFDEEVSGDEAPQVDAGARIHRMMDALGGHQRGAHVEEMEQEPVETWDIHGKQGNPFERPSSSVPANPFLGSSFPGSVVPNDQFEAASQQIGAQLDKLDQMISQQGGASATSRPSSTPFFRIEPLPPFSAAPPASAASASHVPASDSSSSSSSSGTSSSGSSSSSFMPPLAKALASSLSEGEQPSPAEPESFVPAPKSVSFAAPSSAPESFVPAAKSVSSLVSPAEPESFAPLAPAKRARVEELVLSESEEEEGDEGEEGDASDSKPPAPASSLSARVPSFVPLRDDRASGLPRQRSGKVVERKTSSVASSEGENFQPVQVPEHKSQKPTEAQAPAKNKGQPVQPVQQNQRRKGRHWRQS